MTKLLSYESYCITTDKQSSEFVGFLLSIWNLSQRSLHQCDVEPAAELVAHLLESADTLVAMRRVQSDRPAILVAASDECDYVVDRVGFGCSIRGGGDCDADCALSLSDV